MHALRRATHSFCLVVFDYSRDWLCDTGFFIAHAIASSRVGELAISNKGHATSLYLLFYYLGSSIVGAYGGNIWQSHGWNGIVILNIFLILIALIVIFSIKPLHSPSVTH